MLLNWYLPDVQAGFRKGTGIRDQIVNITGSQKRQENSRKSSSSASLTTTKPLTMWLTTNGGKFLKRWEYQTTWPASWEICMQIKKRQLELDMEQQTGSKSGKEYVKAAYCPPTYIAYMQSTSCKMDGAQVGIKIAGRNINNFRYADEWHHPYERKWRRTKEPLDESEKAGLKLNIQKVKMASCPITSWQVDGETMETVTDFILGGSKITADGDCSHEIKRCLLLGGKAMTNLDSILKSRDITLPTKSL